MKPFTGSVSFEWRAGDLRSGGIAFELAWLIVRRLRTKLPALKHALEGRFRPHHALIVTELISRADYIDEVVQRSGEDACPLAGNKIDRLSTVSGVKKLNAEVIAAEVALDLGRLRPRGISHSASWAGICPGSRESGGETFFRQDAKKIEVAADRARRGGKSERRSKRTYLSAQYLRIKAKRGHKRAIIAVTHSIFVAAYQILSEDVD